MNFIEVSATPMESMSVNVQLPAGHVCIPVTKRITSASLTLGVRPEHMRIVDKRDAPLIGEVSFVERLGSETFVYVKTVMETIMVKVDGTTPCAKGDRVGLAFDDEALHLFAQDRSRISIS
jgi:multiple sugar transport system ATP-binding protein